MSFTPKDATISVVITLVGATAAAFIGGDGMFSHANNISAPTTVQAIPEPQQFNAASFQPLVPIDLAPTTTAMEQTMDMAASESVEATFIDERTLTTTNDMAIASNSDALTTQQRQVEQANEKLNLVWSSTSTAVRQKIRTEQRAWLKKRDADCRIDSEDAQPDMREIMRLRCETEVTTQRVGVLQQLIARAEAEFSATDVARADTAYAAAAMPAVGRSASDIATERAAAESAARFAENVRRLEQQLNRQ